MEESKKAVKQELSDQELAQAAGGEYHYRVYERREIRDRRGRVIGEAKNDGSWTFTYWPCPKCDRPMHLGTLNWYYCDPCDYKKFSMPDYLWLGDEASLIAAAD